MEDAETVERPKQKRSVVSILRRMMVTGILLAIVWLTMRYAVLPNMFTGEASKPIATTTINTNDLQERVSALETQLAALKEASPTVNTTIDLSPPEARIAALENKPTPEAAPTVITSNVNSEELAAIKQEVEALKKTDHAYVRSIILFGQLQQAVRVGKPYHVELQTLQAVRPELKDSLAALEDSATIGITTLEQLSSQFKAAITPALNPDDTKKSLANNLRSLVKIRKIGEEQQGDDDEAILARAEAKLKKGDIAESIKEVQQLSPKALAAFDAWQLNAKQHLLALDALENVNNALSQGSKP